MRATTQAHVLRVEQGAVKDERAITQTTKRRGEGAKTQPSRPPSRGGGGRGADSTPGT